MAFSRTLLACAAMTAALSGCTMMDAPPADTTSVAPVSAGTGALDAAVAAAGGKAALAKVKELYWTGAAKVTADGKTSNVNVMTVVRPDQHWARTSTWAVGAESKTSHTLQVERGKAWDVTRQSWQPLPAEQAAHENEQYGLYSMMLLAPLMADGAKAEAAGAGMIKATLSTGQTADLIVDATGKLVGAKMNVTNPKGGADIVETVTFSGEIESNGVKWPKRIKIEQNGAPFYDLEIAKFEAAAAPTPRPMEQSMQYEPSKVVPGESDAG
jgi:hypothetical protein